MGRTSNRCDEIIALIDLCLSDYEAALGRTPTSRARQPGRREPDRA
jgi:hypothetical protein